MITTGWIIAIFEFILMFFFIFIKSYSAKKGENQATKEDIGKITQIAESIKKDLADNTEKLKADLALKNEYLIGLTGIERDAILGYYKELYNFINYLLRLDLTIYNLNNYNDIDTIKIDIDKEFYKYNIAEAFIEFFVDNENFIKKKLELNTAIIQLSSYVSINCLNCKHLFEKASIDLQYKSKPELDVRSELREKSIEFFKEYYEERLKKYIPIKTLSREIKDIIKERLHKVMNIQQ